MKLIILDRDGVINQDSPDFVKNAEEWIPLEGSLEAIALLNQAGYRVVIASNQSGLGRGLFSIDDLNAMHQKLRRLLQDLGGHIDAIFFCPHHPDEDCSCRKPKHGLFTQIQERYSVDMSQVYAVGDSQRDLDASLVLGCQPVLVLTGNGHKTHTKGLLPSNTLIFNRLLDFAHFITGQTL